MEDNKDYTRRNRFNGETVELTKEEAEKHDKIFYHEAMATLEDQKLGTGASKHWKEMHPIHPSSFLYIANIMWWNRYFLLYRKSLILSYGLSNPSANVKLKKVLLEKSGPTQLHFGSQLQRIFTFALRALG